MNKIFTGIVIGLILGIVLFLGVQDYLITKSRVTNIENFLNQAVRQGQQRQASPEVKK